MNRSALVAKSAGMQISMLPSPLEDEIVRIGMGKNVRSISSATKRPEKNYSVVGEKQFKNPLLFPPPKTKGLDQPRKVVFGSTTSETGDAVERSIEVLGNNVTSGYTSDTLDVIAVVNQMWREQGSSSEGVVLGSYGDVARRLGKDENNAVRHRKAVAKELERLRRCVLIFSQYHTKSAVKNNHEITYFSDYQYVLDKANPANNYFRAMIDPHVLLNLRSGYIASLPIAALLALKHDKSKPVILRVDSVLAIQEKCELSCESIYELAAVELTDWTRKPVNRRRTLEDIRVDIDGKVLSSGWMVCVSLVEDVKGECIKLVFARGEKVHSKEPLNASAKKILTVINTDAFLVQLLVNDIASAVGGNDVNASLYGIYARSYPEELIRRALSEFKGDKPSDIRSPGAFFSSILSRIIQEHGYAWIK